MARGRIPKGISDGGDRNCETGGRIGESFCEGCVVVEGDGSIAMECEMGV